MSKFLVTGAGGFIGSHLTETLLREGHSVKAFVHYNSRNTWGWLEACKAELASQLEIVAGNIRDPFSVKKAMAGCDIVLHLAALIAIPYSYTSPASYVDANISGTLNVLQAALELGVKRVVHTSTSEVYGTALFVPITEEHPLQGQSPYSATKIGADQLALSFYRSFDLPVVVCRPFNTYGPRQSARAVIPTIILQLASGQRRLKLGAVHPTRDFNYVQDIANGFLSLATEEGVDGEVFNLGTGFDISIGDIAKLIGELMGSEVEFDLQQERLRPVKSEVERLQASNQKILNLKRWSPKFSGIDGLKRGLSLAIDWFTKKENLSQYKCMLYNT